jgi:hypothetical protein
MQNHDDRNGKVTARSFKASSLKVEPSLIAIACYLARVAAERDYAEFSKQEQMPYTVGKQKGGPA